MKPFELYIVLLIILYAPGSVSMPFVRPVFDASALCEVPMPKLGAVLLAFDANS